MSRVPIRLNSRSKFHAKRTNGYASKRESTRAAELHLAQTCGMISDLREQVSYELLPAQREIGFNRPLRYVADFVYRDRDGIEVIEDVKGFRTREYRIKKRLMWQVHKIAIRES